MNAITRITLVALILATQIFVQGKVVVAQSDNPALQGMSEVYLVDEEIYLPKFGTVYEDCDNIKIRDVQVERDASINGTANDGKYSQELELHGNINYIGRSGLPSANLTPQQLNASYWLGTDAKPGDGCNNRVVAPISGTTFPDGDMNPNITDSASNGGWECNIIGTGRWEGFVVKLLHLSADECPRGSVEVGDYVGTPHLEYGDHYSHVHVSVMYKGTNRWYDIPFILLTDAYQGEKYIQYSEYRVLPDETITDTVPYGDFYSPVDNEVCGYMYHPQICGNTVPTKPSPTPTDETRIFRAPVETEKSVVDSLFGWLSDTFSGFNSSKEIPPLSGVYFYEEGRYLPSMGTVFEGCDNLMIRQVEGERASTTEREYNLPNDGSYSEFFGWHANDNYERALGIPTSSLSAIQVLTDYWLGTDMVPGQGCSSRNVAPISGYPFPDADVAEDLHLGKECNIEGAGTWEGFAVKLLHQAEDMCGSMETVNKGDYVGELGLDYGKDGKHLHVTVMYRGAERWYDIPYVLLTDARFSRYGSGSYNELYSQSDSIFCENFYHKDICEPKLSEQEMEANTINFYGQGQSQNLEIQRDLQEILSSDWLKSVAQVPTADKFGLSEVFNLEDQRYLPKIGPLFDCSQELMRDDPRTDIELHENMNPPVWSVFEDTYRIAGSPNWAQDIRPGDGCSNQVIAPISGPVYRADPIAPLDYECMIEGSGIWKGIIIKILHLESDTCPNVVEVGDVIGTIVPDSQSWTAHAHVGVHIKGSERYFDVPYSLLSTSNLGTYTDEKFSAFSIQGASLCGHLYHPDLCSTLPASEAQMANSTADFYGIENFILPKDEIINADDFLQAIGTVLVGIQQGLGESGWFVTEGSSVTHPSLNENYVLDAFRGKGYQFPLHGEVFIGSHSGDHLGRGSVLAIDIIPNYPDALVYPMHAGTVSVASPNNEGGYGWWVMIDHGDGLLSLYGHCVANSFKVKVGDTVDLNTPLCTVGWTGMTSFGPHTHVEVHIRNYDGPKCEQSFLNQWSHKNDRMASRICPEAIFNMDLIPYRKLANIGAIDGVVLVPREGEVASPLIALTDRTGGSTLDIPSVGTIPIPAFDVNMPDADGVISFLDRITGYFTNGLPPAEKKNFELWMGRILLGFAVLVSLIAILVLFSDVFMRGKKKIDENPGLSYGSYLVQRAVIAIVVTYILIYGMSYRDQIYSSVSYVAEMTYKYGSTIRYQMFTKQFNLGNETKVAAVWGSVSDNFTVGTLGLNDRSPQTMVESAIEWQNMLKASGVTAECVLIPRMPPVNSIVGDSASGGTSYTLGDVLDEAAKQGCFVVYDASVSLSRASDAIKTHGTHPAFIGVAYDMEFAGDEGRRDVFSGSVVKQTAELLYKNRNGKESYIVIWDIFHNWSPGGLTAEDLERNGVKLVPIFDGFGAAGPKKTGLQGTQKLFAEYTTEYGMMQFDLRWPINNSCGAKGTTAGFDCQSWQELFSDPDIASVQWWAQQ